MENLRLFIGLALSEPIMDRLSDRMKRMADALPFRRWTHPADLHITMHFLGDTPASQVDANREALARAAALTAPLPLSVAGPGTFGPPGAPRVLWCGVEELAAPGAMAALHRALGERLAAAGCKLEARPFRAHITLARQGGAGCGREAVEAAWQAAASSDGPERLTWTVDRVTLFRSHLGRRPSYERLAEIPLGSAGAK